MLRLDDGEIAGGGPIMDVYVAKGRRWRGFVFARECDNGRLSASSIEKPPFPCPRSDEFLDLVGDDSPGSVVDVCASPAAAVGYRQEAMPQKKSQQKDVLTKLADAGEEAIQRLSELPGGARFAEAAHALRERLEDLTAKVRRLDPLERRVAELERRLDELSASTKTRRAKPTAPRATASRARKS